MARAAPAPATRDQWWEAIAASVWFVPLQQRAEMLDFLAFIERQGDAPRAVCEIGVAAGGTTFLLTRVAGPEARVVLVDRSLPSAHALAAFARDDQRVIAIEDNSQTKETAARVRHALGGLPLDVLFIDADHSLAGVSRDFALYTPLLRPGGIVALHDINLDHRHRLGAGRGDAGDVAAFWAALDPALGTRHEFIADPAQDGGGIGALVWGA